MQLIKQRIIGRAPGRICLLGDNVDLIEGPVLAAAIAVYQRLQSHIATGFEATIQSQIPVSAGISSSTALCIAFIRALTRLLIFLLTRLKLLSFPTWWSVKT